jgi:hypothetical protein
MSHTLQQDLISEAAQRDVWIDISTNHSKCIAEIGGEPVSNNAFKTKNLEDTLPAPTRFARGTKARRSSPIPIKVPSKQIFAAHRAAVGRVISASESAEWQSTKTSSWDEALELLQ